MSLVVVRYRVLALTSLRVDRTLPIPSHPSHGSPSFHAAGPLRLNCQLEAATSKAGELRVDEVSSTVRRRRGF